jgi:hypothetical protein
MEMLAIAKLVAGIAVFVTQSMPTFKVLAADPSLIYVVPAALRASLGVWISQAPHLLGQPLGVVDAEFAAIANDTPVIHVAYIVA